MKVVVSGMVWLPKSELSSQNIRNIKDRLVFRPRRTTDIGAKADPAPIYMYSDHERYLGVPRDWYLKNITKRHDEMLRVSYGSKMSDFESKYRAEGKFSEQLDALRVLEASIDGEKWGGVLLNGGCSFGKSNVGIEFARRLGRSTMILVHKEFLMDQWAERIDSLMPGARVGFVRQNKCDYKGEDFVIGMVQSLEKSNKYDDDLWSAFGTVVTDEVHRMGSASWSKVMPKFDAAWRVGLTATVDRKDGAHISFMNHIGDVTYSAKTQARVPEVRVVETDFRLSPISRGDYYVPVPKLNSAQVVNQIAGDEIRTREVIDQVVSYACLGRKVMVISDRLGHLKYMGDAISKIVENLSVNPQVDYFTGDWFTGEVWNKTTKTHRMGEPKLRRRTRDELKRAERANIIMSTRQMCVDGDSVVVDAITGIPIKVKDIIDEIGKRDVFLMSYDVDSGKFYPNRVASAWSNGVKNVRDIYVGRGGVRSSVGCSVTDNHLLLTQRGWVKAGDVVVGDWLKVPLKVPGDCNSGVDEHDARLLGYMIGDGCTSVIGKSGVAYFFNIDESIVSDMSDLLARHGASLHKKEHGKYSIRSGGKRGAGAKSSFRRLIECHGLDGCRAWEKVLSLDLMQCSVSSSASLIAGLIASDGSIGRKKVSVSHTSSSMILSYQIHRLLLKLGIVSRVRHVKSRNIRMDYWKVDVTGIWWVRKFKDVVGPFLPSVKATQLDNLCGMTRREEGIGRRVPEEQWLHAMRIVRSNGINKEDIYDVRHAPIGAKVSRNGVDRSLLESVSHMCDDNTINRWSEDQGGWERVSNIEIGRECQVYDLSMDCDPNFVCDDVVVHNCQEGLDIQAIDVIVFAVPPGDPEQPVGRSRRWCYPEVGKCSRLCSWRAGMCTEKPKPIVVEMLDRNIPRLVSKFERRKEFYKRIGAMCAEEN